MYRFIIQKLLNKKWLISCMLIGTILLIAIAACNPMYKSAALQKMLTDELASYLEKNNEYPAVAKVYGNISDTRLGMYSSGLFGDYKTAADSLAGLYSHPTAARITYLRTHALLAKLEEERENIASLEMSMDTLFDLSEHVDVVYGNMYSDQVSSDGYIECIINESMMIQMGLIIGDTLVMPVNYTDGNPVKLRVVGVFQAKDPAEPYWVNDSLSYNNSLFIDSSLYDRIFMSSPMLTSVTGEYYAVFDYQTIKTDELNDFIRTDNKIREDCNDGGLYDCAFNYEGSFTSYRGGSNQVNITMLIFQIPVLILLAVFIFMVSNQIISIEQGEIAMLKSRGVSKGQLIRAYLLQGCILSAIGLVIGIPLGYLFCMLFGATRSFLEFSVRTSLEVHITAVSVLYGFIAALVSIIIMTIPVMKYANFSIVEQKVNKKKSTRPLWQKMFIDVILLAVAIYGFYNFNHQKDIIITEVASDEALDPLLYFSSTIFILALALLLLRIIPYISGFVYWLRKKKWKPASYAAFMQINKTIRKQSFIMVFLVLTLALGIFNAITARTITDNEEMRITYDNGADLNVTQSWKSNLAGIKAGYADELEYYEPDFTPFEELSKSVDGMTKVVVDDKADVSAIKKFIQGATTYMAIDTYEFGHTAYLPKGSTRFHWYYYLNALAYNPSGAIISRNLSESAGLGVGDAFVVGRTDKTGVFRQMNVTVSAIVDAWPGYESKVYARGNDGNFGYIEHYLVVVNFLNGRKTFGLEPYQIWISNKSTDFIYDFAEKNNISFSEFHDSHEEAESIKSEPFYQITSGMLTIAFIVVLILSMIGFLIYWITSIKSRELMFGIYRAMGMSMGEIIHMLIYEHVFGSLIPILYGVLVGVVAARLFVPLIELAYISSYTTLDTRVIISAGDMIRLAVCVIMMLLVCFLVIGRILKNMKITQALKLGED